MEDMLVRNGSTYSVKLSAASDDGESFSSPMAATNTAFASPIATDYRMLPLAMGILQACSFVGIGKTKTQELINRGDVATAKVDGRTLVLTDSVVALVERNRVARGQ